MSDADLLQIEEDAFPLEYGLDAIDRAYVLTGGQPFLGQLLGDSLVQRFNRQLKQQIEPPDPTFTAADVDAVVEDSRFYLNGHVYFNGIWAQAGEAPPGQRALLKILADCGDGLDQNAWWDKSSLDPAAFEAAYRFITGQAPRTQGIVPEAAPVLNGQITGLGVNPADPKTGNFSNNLPLPGAQLEVYATHPTTGERLGAAVHRKTVGADGVWGPFTAQTGQAYEFVVSAPGYATTHIYRSPFARSSALVHLRPERIADADRDAQALVSFVRPRGYFDPARDRMSLDGKAQLPGVRPGAGDASAKLKLADAAMRTVTGEFNGERVAGRTWPVAENRVSVLELTY